MLNMISVHIDRYKFNRWAGQRDLVKPRIFDEGYALHVLLTGMFGREALHTFRLYGSEHSRNATLYAYTSLALNELKKMADTVATPDCIDVINPEKLLCKPMRSEFSSGQPLGFDIRVRPVCRLINERELYAPQSKRKKTLKRGAEIDVYWAHRLRHFPDGRENEAGSDKHGSNTRERVYSNWLAERLEGAARIDECRLDKFMRNRVFRGNGSGIEGPDAVLHGALMVDSPEAFAERIRKGIGRHKAYGYGMLLLRPHLKRVLPEDNA